MSRCYCEQCQKSVTLGVYFLVSWSLQFVIRITASVLYNICTLNFTSVFSLFSRNPCLGNRFCNIAAAVLCFGCRGLWKLSSVLPTVVYSNDKMYVWVWFMQTAPVGHIYHVYGKMFKCDLSINALLCHRRYWQNYEMMGRDLNDLSECVCPASESLRGRWTVAAECTCAAAERLSLLMCIWQYL